MNRAELENKVKALELELSQAKERLAALPDKWRPKGGKFYVDEEGSVSEKVSHLFGNQDFGNEYATREQAEKASKAMRAHNRLLAYVAEFAPEHSYKFDDVKWFVSYDTDALTWFADFCTDFVVGVAFMPELIARELAAKLNTGEVEL